MEQAIKDIKEAGQLQRIKKRWSRPKAECGSLLMKGTTLDFQKLAGPFMIIVSGIVLALLLMVSEKVMAHMEQKRIKRFRRVPKYHRKVLKANTLASIE